MKLKTCLIERLLEDDVIAVEETEIIDFGLKNIRSSLIGLFLTLLIGSYFGLLSESFILWLLVLPLRKNAGGFHANTKLNCLILSVGMLIVTFAGLIQNECPIYVYLLISLIFFIVIFWMAPVENYNKILDSVERKVYKKRTRIVLILEEILWMFSFFLEWKIIISLITASFAITGSALIIGKMKLYHNM